MAGSTAAGPLIRHHMGEAAHRVRYLASDVVSRSNGGVSARAADALGIVSMSLATAAEGARITGNALRDRGRDAARSVGRGERILRESGFGGAAVAGWVLLRRHSRKFLIAGTGVLGYVAIRQIRSFR